AGWSCGQDALACALARVLLILLPTRRPKKCSRGWSGMLRLLIVLSVVLALGVGVSSASAGEGKPPNPKKPCTKGHSHKQGLNKKSKCSNAVHSVRQQAASSIGVVAPWGSAVYSGSDTITLTYSISAAKSIPSTAVDAIQQAVDDWASWLQGHDGSGSFTIAPAAPGSRAI